MELPKEAVNEFRDIYKRKFGIKLSFKVAQMEAINFVNLFALVTSRPKNENEKLYKNTE